MHHNPAKDAIYSAKRNYEISFGSEMSAQRRNLFFIVILSFAALLVTPKDGEYSINLGIIAGGIKNPIYIYVGLLLICAYQVYYFWILCRSGVVDLRNITRVEELYMYELASLVAFNEWNRITKKYRENFNVAVVTFTESPKAPREDGCYKVRVETQEAHLDEIVGLISDLESDGQFYFGKNRGFYQVDFKYCPRPDDYKYLMLHRDLFWLAKMKQIIEFLLPLTVGLLALMALCYKISWLICRS